MIAMAMVNNPDVLIADEPTTALDVTVQAQILELIDRVKQEFNIGVILITHDLGVIAEVAQTVMVMYAGRSMELGSRRRTSSRQPLHPYTWGLLESIPQAEQKASSLVPIEGSPPSLIFVPPGCPFHPPLPAPLSPCDQERPEFRDRGGGHRAPAICPIDDKRRLWLEREAKRVRSRYDAPSRHPSPSPGRAAATTCSSRSSISRSGSRSRRRASSSGR